MANDNSHLGDLFDLVASKTGGLLSILGSAYIIQDVVRSQKKRKDSFYHPLMLGLSVMDLIVSLFLHFLTNWPIPRTGWIENYAMGSVGTCDFAGFCNTIGLYGGPLYNCSLSTYFLLELRYTWTKSKIQRVHKWMHIVPWASGIILAFAALAANTLGPTQNACWITRGYPNNCEEDIEVECVRGGHSVHELFWLLLLVLQIASIFYVSVTMYLTYKSVLRVEKNSEKYTFARYSTIASDRKKRERSKRVMLQGCLYSLALLLTYFVPCTFFILHKFGIASEQVTKLFSIFMPLQGFYNVFIYVLPQILKKVKTLRKSKRLRTSMEESNITQENQEKSDLNQQKESKDDLSPELASFPIVAESSKEAEDGKSDDMPIDLSFRSLNESVGNVDVDVHQNNNNAVDEESKNDSATELDRKLSVTFASAQIHEYTVEENEDVIDGDSEDSGFDDYYIR